MRNIILLTLSIFTISAYGQDKYNYTHFNKLTEVEGTEYVIASVENRGKSLTVKNRYLLFIDTKTGDTNRVSFSEDSKIIKVKQIKIDDLGINLILVAAKTHDLDGKNGINWNDPQQLLILSPNGKQKTQITENNFFVRSRVVNKQTGTIVITGHRDTNDNKKYDKTDKNEILVYDLAKMKLINKF